MIYGSDCDIEVDGPRNAAGARVYVDGNRSLSGLGKSKKAKKEKVPPFNPLSVIPPDNSGQIIRAAVIIAGGAVIFYLVSSIDIGGILKSKKKVPAKGGKA